MYKRQEFSKKVQSHNRAADEVQEWIEDFLKGFQGAGFDRTWCAQDFYPIVRTFLAQETIWPKKHAKKQIELSEVRFNPLRFYERCV